MDKAPICVITRVATVPYKLLGQVELFPCNDVAISFGKVLVEQVGTDHSHYGYVGDGIGNDLCMGGPIVRTDTSVLTFGFCHSEVICTFDEGVESSKLQPIVQIGDGK